MKKTTGILIACVMIVLAGSLYYFLKDEPLVPKLPEVAQKTQETSKMSYAGNTITEEDNGKKLWELKAETIEMDAETKNVLLHNINGTFYQDKGGKIDITAPEGFIDDKTKEIKLSAKVHAVASDGGTFTANEARWSGKEKYFYGSGDVIVTKEDTVITGDKLESDANMEKIKMSGHAKVIKGGAHK
jgi:LPS export ABC transporter protein LptC